MVAKQGDMLSATAKIPKVRVRRRDATYPSIVLNALSNNRVNFQFPFFGGHLEGQCNVTEVPRPGLKPREILGRSKGQDTNGCDRVIEPRLWFASGTGLQRSVSRTDPTKKSLVFFGEAEVFFRLGAPQWVGLYEKNSCRYDPQAVTFGCIGHVVFAKPCEKPFEYESR